MGWWCGDVEWCMVSCVVAVEWCMVSGVVAVVGGGVGLVRINESSGWLEGLKV